MKVIFALILLSGTYGWMACGGNKQIATASHLEEAVSGSPDVPTCISKMIDSAKASTDGQGITEVRRYLYKGSKVYLVGSPCCDQFNNLYDSTCQVLFAPSGGFTGKGDRSNPDFFTIAKEDSLIWKKEK